MTIYVPMDLIAVAGTQADAVAFSVPDWTQVCHIGTHTGFTSHTQSLYNGPISQIIFRAVVGGTTTGAMVPQVRVTSLYYDANNNQVWNKTYPAVVKRDAYNPDNVTAFILPQAQVDLTAAGYCYFVPEVKGTGYLYMARLEVLYTSP